MMGALRAYKIGVILIDFRILENIVENCRKRHRKKFYWFNINMSTVINAGFSPNVPEFERFDFNFN